MQHAQAAGLAPPDALADLAHHRVEAVDEGHGPDEAGRGGQLFQPDGVRHSGRQRLLAHDVLAGPQSLFDQAHMGGVGGAYVDNVDVGRLDQLAGAGRGPLGLCLCLQRMRQAQVVVGDADQDGPGCSHRPGMHAAHKTGPYDGYPNSVRFLLCH